MLIISAIVPTRNRASLLSRALASLEAQQLDLKAFEVLVVDNASTDQSATVVEDWTRRLENLRYYYEAEPGLHAGRHRGMLEAKGHVLVFADDDIEALPTWLSTMADGFADPTVAMIGGNNLPRFPEPPPRWLEGLWNRPQRDGSRSLPWLSVQERPAGRYPISPYLVWGCNFGIRKDVLLAAGGFHPDGMPRELIRFRGDGETHVSRYVAEKGLKCLFDSGASVYHKVTTERMTFDYFRQRGFNQGVSDSYTRLRAEVGAATYKQSLPYRIARWGWQKLRSLNTRRFLSTDEWQAMKELQIGHREGFAYHQAAYRDDPEVCAWVHRERYY